MYGAPIYFQFNEKNAAYQALDTLTELGYHVHFMEQNPDRKPTLQVFVEKDDLTSALEIAQAHGGTVLEQYDAPHEHELYSSAYGLGEADPIPAHVVTEDLPEDYMSGRASSPHQSGYGGEEHADGTPEPPSGEDYDHFPAGIRL